MKRPFLAADARYPVTLPDGTVLQNLVYLNQVINHPNIEVGDYTYFNSFEPVKDYAPHIAPYLYEGAPERLIIGKFGQFANGTLFITSSANHPMQGFSTYPFAIFTPETMRAYADENAVRGDTIVGNDVWIGNDAKIMPGVKIGDGAIIGAGAVVARDVPPYAIVAGNPAKVIRLRFASDVIARLLEIRWWDWPLEMIEANHAVISSADISALGRT
ncbi:Xenobiotic acyltransferase XAT family [hydrothermal vent metagenome]|uniref:Xenobiotic acyltransferase XAT family n=1 Tax=hydrothermal vent metagenome TaxID=652676 RepID=A0A3B0SCW7_9ZZZZ